LYICIEIFIFIDQFFILWLSRNFWKTFSSVNKCCSKRIAVPRYAYPSYKQKLNAFGFQKQRGVYLNKSFYLEKLRVSFVSKITYIADELLEERNSYLQLQPCSVEVLSISVVLMSCKVIFLPSHQISLATMFVICELKTAVPCSAYLQESFPVYSATQSLQNVASPLPLLPSDLIKHPLMAYSCAQVFVSNDVHPSDLSDAVWVLTYKTLDFINFVISF